MSDHDSSTEATKEDLRSRLKGAADGNAEAVEEFLRVLLNSSIFVPRRLRPDVQGLTRRELPIIGESTSEQFEFLVIVSEGREVLPIFSDEQYLQDWLGEEAPFEKVRFASLIWEVEKETWMHLNPGQEVGKEISPWEIELLKQGPDAVPEIAAEISGVSEDIEVRSDPDLFPDLKRQLRPVLELFAEIEEAFLVSVTSPEMGEGCPILGLRHKGLDTKKLDYLNGELRTIVEQHFDTDKDLVFVKDIDNKKDPNVIFFREVTPFYIAQKKLAKQGKTWFAKLLRRKP